MPGAVLARRAGVSTNDLYMIERGARAPSMALLEKIARELRVEPAELLKEPAPLDLGLADLEDWAAGVDSIPELKRAAKSLWPLYARLAGTIGRPVPAGDAGQLAEAGRKLDIINERMVELAPVPLATITERLDGPTWVIYHGGATPEVRARLRREYPGATEIEAQEPVLVYS